MLNKHFLTSMLMVLGFWKERGECSVMERNLLCLATVKEVGGGDPLKPYELGEGP